MKSVSRRQFLKTGAAMAAMGTAGHSLEALAQTAARKGRVIVLGFDGVRIVHRRPHARTGDAAESGQVAASRHVQPNRDNDPPAVAGGVDVIRNLQESRWPWDL